MSTVLETIPALTLGLDVGDRWIVGCLIDAGGELVAETRVRSRPDSVRDYLKSLGNARVVVEVGGHSRWISEIAAELGHEVIVANPQAVAQLARGRKTDRLDAKLLARLGRFDPELLRPIRHRSRPFQTDRAVLKARDAVVRARTEACNAVRGILKSFGTRPPRCTIAAFPKVVDAVLPEDLRPALEPLLRLQLFLTRLIREYDKKIAVLGEERYPDTARLRQVNGVGPLTGLQFVLTIEDPRRFAKSRTVGAYVGLCPRKNQSGNSDPELRISKSGDPDLRRLLVQCAQYILGPFGKDSHLRRYGIRIAERGQKNAKKRAVIAVARKLAVLLHRLWVSGETYEPLRASRNSPAATSS